MRNSFFLKQSMFMLIMLILGGCGSALKYPNGLQYAPDKPYDSNQQTALQEALWDELEKWQGVPYKWGGNSKNGVDCSGLAVIVYKKLFGISLPRNTREQAQAGTNVSKKKIQPGDLIFFLSPKKARHVGIYLGNRKFTHASVSKKKVVIANIDHPYWRKAYWTSRRVISKNYAQAAW